jgi:hypothetical protein
VALIDLVTRRPPSAPPPSNGLDRVEVVLFLFGVAAFAVLMLAFGQPLVGSDYLPLVAAWIVAGVTFVWWFHRFLSRRDR